MRVNDEHLTKEHLENLLQSIPSFTMTRVMQLRSYRGDYADLAFVQNVNARLLVPVKNLLIMLNHHMRQYGWKGGVYEVHAHTPVWLVNAADDADGKYIIDIKVGDHGELEFITGR